VRYCIFGGSYPNAGGLASFATIFGDVLSAFQMCEALKRTSFTTLVFYVFDFPV
jgi:hypothetical protein